MAKVRKYDEVDTSDTETQPPSAKHPRRRLSYQSERQQDRVTVTAKSAPLPIPPVTNVPESRSQPRETNHAAARDIDEVAEHSCTRSHISSDNEDSHSLSDHDVSSPQGRVSSGIEGSYFPDTYDIPSPDDRVPSGIEGFYFPESYVSAQFASPGSEPSSTVMPPAMSPEAAQKAFEDQYHFYNDNGARSRGKAIVEEALAILKRPRGSPTAKEKAPQLQKAAQTHINVGENDLANALVNILLNEGRMVPKAGVEPGAARNVEDFEPDSNAWTKDFLGRRTKTRFHEKAIPQARASDGTFEKQFHSWPRLNIPVPDLIYGIEGEALGTRWRSIFENAGVKILNTKGVHHIFLAGEIKTKDRPHAEAQVQCQRTGSAIVKYKADWDKCTIDRQRSNDKEGSKDTEASKDEEVSKTINVLPEVDVDTDTSIPDRESFCFTMSIAPDICRTYVNWRESWPNGADFWHTTVLKTYSLDYGMQNSTEKFQRHLSNIIDWGLLERAPKIYKQARAHAKRRVDDADFDLPLPTPKRQR